MPVRNALRRKGLSSVVLLLCSCASETPGSPATGRPREEVLKELQSLQEQRVKNGQPPLTLLDLCNMYDEEGKRGCLQPALRTGVFLPVEGRWDLIDTPEQALAWALHEDEPLSDQVLTVLERTFPECETPEQCFGMAALLYRYRRDSGRRYLQQELREKDSEEAALILALNEEKDSFAEIAVTFLKTKSKSNALAFALAEFGPETGYLFERRILQGEELWYAHPLVRSGKKSVDPIIVSKSRDAYHKPQIPTLWGIEYGTVYALLNPADVEMKESVWADVEAATKDGVLGVPEYVMEELARLDRDRAGKTFLRLTETWHSQKQSRPDWLYYQVCAAVWLVRADPRQGVPLAVEALRKMLEDKIADREVFAIAQAIYDTGLPKRETLLDEIMGKGWVAKLQALRRLRPLPRSYLPLSSQPFLPRSWDESG